MTFPGSISEKKIGGTQEQCTLDVALPGTKLQGSPIVHSSTFKGCILGDIVPDSEEDRTKSDHTNAEGVIVISSDSEEEEKEVKAMVTFDSAKKVHLSSSGSGSEGLNELLARRKLKIPNAGKHLAVARRIIESSESEEDSEPKLPLKYATKHSTKKRLTDDIIELTSSSEGCGQAMPQRSRTNSKKASRENFPPYLTQEDDGAILIFDEPKSAKKPVRIAVLPKRPPLEQWNDSTTDRPTSSLLLKSLSLCDDLDPNARVDAPIGRKIIRPKSAKTTTRMSKKAAEEAEQARREKYAQELFDELNKSVFGNGLPENTKLNWNKRLLTTAGKARYRRSRHGVETSEIELATKILDCDERIRNTLSHEMCHLATWVIDKRLDENHGKLFKYWASKVIKRRSDIEITTRHNYEISYPYRWECQKCQKIYGRYSKSIRPDECVCGVCREGRLVPLFAVRSKTPKIRPQDPPMKAGQTDSDVDPEMETLTTAVARTHL